jgi:methylenetetrahydrofolate dehydrogenase (NADP+)/methenyltetrahydrofolate cyclohydrolase
MALIDGKEVAAGLQEALKKKVASLKGRAPSLKVILVGQNPASLVYTRRKLQAAQTVGIHSEIIELGEKTSEAELLSLIQKLNESSDVDGILVQLPLPPQIDPHHVITAIDPGKDVDGFHPLNLGRLLAGDAEGFVPCTPLGIQKLLLAYNVNPEGKHVLIVGRSQIVGKPLAALLMQNSPGANATVTVAHSKTANLPSLARSADILIAAIGKPRFIQASMIRPGAVIIDVGINAEEGRLVGDVDFENVAPLASLITPVPGGVGPMTIACLLSNTLKAREMTNNLSG